jgi:hypothetical protein
MSPTRRANIDRLHRQSRWQPERPPRLAHLAGIKNGRSGADGIAVDKDGRVFVTSNAGIEVFDASGKALGVIALLCKPQNLRFGGADHARLYAVGAGSVYRIPLTGDRLVRKNKVQGIIMIFKTTLAAALFASGASVAYAAAEVPAIPAEEAEGAVITVTACNKAEDIRNVPIPISVISADTAATQQIYTIADLTQRAPSLTRHHAQCAAHRRVAARHWQDQRQ